MNAAADTTPSRPRTFDERRIDRLKTAVEELLRQLDPRWPDLGRWTVDLGAPPSEAAPRGRVVVRIVGPREFGCVIEREDERDGGRTPTQLAVYLLEQLLRMVSTAIHERFAVDDAAEFARLDAAEFARLDAAAG